MRLLLLSRPMLAILITACAANAAVDPTPRPSTATVKVPVLRASDPSQETQEKDGIRVVATIEPFTVRRVSRKEYRSVPQLISIGAGRPVDRRETTSPVVEPEALRIKLRIANRLGRIVRLAGAVVSFQVSGRTIAVPQERMASFLSGIVLPRQENEFDLTGPDLAQLVGPNFDRLPGDTASVALLLYDVVTATDAAGNPTKRSNFEIYYRLSLANRPDSVVTTVTRLSLSLGWASYVARLQGGDANRWVAMPQLDCLPTCQ